MFSRMISERTRVKYALFDFMRTLVRFKIVNQADNVLYSDWTYVETYIIKYGKHGKYTKTKELLG